MTYELFLRQYNEEMARHELLRIDRVSENRALDTAIEQAGFKPDECIIRLDDKVQLWYTPEIQFRRELQGYISGTFEGEPLMTELDEESWEDFCNFADSFISKIPEFYMDRGARARIIRESVDLYFHLDAETAHNATEWLTSMDERSSKIPYMIPPDDFLTAFKRAISGRETVVIQPRHSYMPKKRYSRTVKGPEPIAINSEDVLKGIRKITKKYH